MITIGLTGGIASGKSTVASELRRLQLPVFDADQCSREAVAKGSRGLAQVVELFGSDYLTEEGELNRPKVAELIFKDAEAKAKLEALLHAVVWQAAEEFLAVAKAHGASVAVLDVPLLIECGWHKRVDQVWLVAVEPETQIQRAMVRSGMTRAEVEARIKAQLSLQEKAKHAQVVLDNSGALEATLAQVHAQLALLQ